MKKLFPILFLIVVFKITAAQNNILSKSILIVPLNSDMVMIGKKTENVLKYNNIKPEEFITQIKPIIEKQIMSAFKHYKIDNLYIDYPSVCDSLHNYKIYNNFNLADTSNAKLKIKNYNSYTNKYYSRIIDTYNETILKAIIEKSKADYIIMFNCFEIDKRRFWSNKSFFELHCEIFDKDFNRIYGGKNSYSRVISIKMYADVLKYYSKQSIENQLKILKKVISIN